MHFGKRLREIRLYREMTQEALSERIDVALRSYQKYEQGIREPRFETLVALADALEVSTDVLLCREDFRPE